MRTRIGLLAIVAALAAAPVQTARPADADAGVLTVRSAGGPISQGSVGVIAVQGPYTLTALEGTAFDRPVSFWPLGGGRWHGLIAAGVETPPGAYEVAIHGKRASGESIAAALTVRVTARKFETRSLRVAQRFATPPAAEAERIQQDARLLADVFSGTTDRIWRGPFALPVSGRATSSFGRMTVLNGKPNGRHQGADFRAARGTTVLAPNAGRVVLATNLYFAGNTVILDHGLGLFSLFAHLSATSVALGDLVERGDEIGEAGATGRVTGPHLHWAVRLGSLSIDPLSLVAATRDLPEADATPALDLAAGVLRSN